MSSEEYEDAESAAEEAHLQALTAIVDEQPAIAISHGGAQRDAAPRERGLDIAAPLRKFFAPKESTVRPNGEVEVRGASIQAAKSAAERLLGPYELLDGYQTYTLLGKKQTVLVVRPAAREYRLSSGFHRTSMLHAAERRGRDAGSEVLWNRATLRALGVPPSIMRRLPLEDPEGVQEWEAALLPILAHALEAAHPYEGSARVSGVGGRGAAAILAGAEAGISPGSLRIGDLELPATPIVVLAALRDEMPLRDPLPPLNYAPHDDPQEALSGNHDPDIALPGPPRPRTDEVAEAYRGETLAEEANTADPHGQADGREAAAQSEMETQEDTLESGLGATTTEQHPDSASAEPGAPRPREGLGTAAMPAVGRSSGSVSMSREVRGKLPRGTRPRRVPGNDITPYPSDEGS